MVYYIALNYGYNVLTISVQQHR